MKRSTRNQLTGTVTAIITSSITKEAGDDLELAVGSTVTALVKSTEVALAVE